MEIKTNILENLADKIGEEHQRIAAVAFQVEAPWDVPEVPHMISADERAMLCQAADGVSWPAETAEAYMCEWLEENGLLSGSGKGSKRVWKRTAAGENLASHIHGETKRMCDECELGPDTFAALKNDAAAEVLVRGGMPKP